MGGEERARGRVIGRGGVDLVRSLAPSLSRSLALYARALARKGGATRDR